MSEQTIVINVGTWYSQQCEGKATYFFVIQTNIRKQPNTKKYNDCSVSKKQVSEKVMALVSVLTSKRQNGAAGKDPSASREM